MFRDVHQIELSGTWDADNQIQRNARRKRKVMKEELVKVQNRKRDRERVEKLSFQVLHTIFLSSQVKRETERQRDKEIERDETEGERQR